MIVKSFNKRIFAEHWLHARQLARGQGNKAESVVRAAHSFLPWTAETLCLCSMHSSIFVFSPINKYAVSNIWMMEKDFPLG